MKSVLWHIALAREFCLRKQKPKSWHLVFGFQADPATVSQVGFSHQWRRACSLVLGFPLVCGSVAPWDVWFSFFHFGGVERIPFASCLSRLLEGEMGSVCLLIHFPLSQHLFAQAVANGIVFPACRERCMVGRWNRIVNALQNQNQRSCLVRFGGWAWPLVSLFC